MEPFQPHLNDAQKLKLKAQQEKTCGEDSKNRLFFNRAVV